VYKTALKLIGRVLLAHLTVATTSLKAKEHLGAEAEGDRSYLDDVDDGDEDDSGGGEKQSELRNRKDATSTTTAQRVAAYVAKAKASAEKAKMDVKRRVDALSPAVQSSARNLATEMSAMISANESPSASPLPAASSSDGAVAVDDVSVEIDDAVSPDEEVALLPPAELEEPKSYTYTLR
jgi:hypothetical protein